MDEPSIRNQLGAMLRSAIDIDFIEILHGFKFDIDFIEILHGFKNFLFFQHFGNLASQSWCRPIRLLGQLWGSQSPNLCLVPSGD